MASRHLLRPCHVTGLPIEGKSIIQVALSNWGCNLSSQGAPGALGSSLGTDTSMISANNRHKLTHNYSSNRGGNHITLQSPVLLYGSRQENNKIQQYLSGSRRGFNSSPTIHDSMKDEYGDMTSDGSTYVHNDWLLHITLDVIPRLLIGTHDVVISNRTKDWCLWRASKPKPKTTRTHVKCR